MFEDAYGNRYWPDGTNPSAMMFSRSAYYWGSGLSSYASSSAYGRLPTAHDSGWYKCPFCGRRQNVKDDGGNCLSCKGDVMHESVR
jgi:hypothetical protein